MIVVTHWNSLHCLIVTILLKGTKQITITINMVIIAIAVISIITS